MKKFFTRKTVQVEIPPATVLPVSTSMPWQRIILSLVGIVIVFTIWERATAHLYSLPITSVTAFTSITNNSLYVVAALVLWFVTGKLIYDWKNSTVSQVIQEAKTITEEKTERTIPPKAFDDGTVI